MSTRLLDHGQRRSRNPGRSEDYRTLNRANWDERAPAHAASPDYAVERFVADPASPQRRRALRPAARSATSAGCAACTCSATSAPTRSRWPGSARTMTGLDFSARRARGRPARWPPRPAPTSTYVRGRRLRRASTCSARALRPRLHRHRRAVLAAGHRAAGPTSSPALLGPAAGCSSARATRCSGRSTTRAPDGLLVARATPTSSTPSRACATTAAPMSRPTPSSQHNVPTAGTTASARSSPRCSTCGLRSRALEEHDSVPWEALPGQMVKLDGGEWQLARAGPSASPHSYTLQAVKRRSA